MAEPQPPNVREGADAPDVLPANAEDRAAAAALSSLDAKDESSKKEMDMKAVTEAMKKLGSDQPKAAATSTTASSSAKKADEVKKPLLKVDPADVNLMVAQLDMNKAKATELLRAHDANVMKAMKAWVTSAV